MLRFSFVIVILFIALLSQIAWKIKPDIPETYVLRYPSYFGNGFRIPTDNPMTREGVELGRMLFYEKRLSANNSLSCASCHKQELAFTDGEQFSLGVNGQRQDRNTMALVNLLWTKSFFWDGRAPSLEEQVAEPLTNKHEMGQSWEQSLEKLGATAIYADKFTAAFGDATISKNKIEKALAQFQRTLISSNSRYDSYLAGKYTPTSTELKGINLFFGSAEMRDGRSGFCAHCHGGPKTYQELFMNNGLDSVFNDEGRFRSTGKEYDRGRFRVATLRNIALTAPYMHDGRFSSLEQVIDHCSEGVLESESLSPFIARKPGKQLNLTREEKNSLLAFLHMLTDSTFITNPAFSDPFISKQKT